MTPRQVQLIQDSWNLVTPIADVAAQLFYTRLFEIAPQVRPMFGSDLTEQKKKLMTTLTVAVRALNDIEALAPKLRMLGARHVKYGVKDEHYEPVGAALLWTLEKGLGHAFTQEVKQAWTDLYGAVVGLMQEGAREVEQPERIAS